MADYTQRPGGIGGPETSRDTLGNDGMDQTRDRAQEYGEKAQEYSEQAKEKAQEYGRQAQQRAEEGKEQAAGGMERAADMVRERTSSGSGMPAEAGAKAADALESASTYLRSHETSEIWNDVETYAKSHPTQALAGAVVAGFVLGRILR